MSDTDFPVTIHAKDGNFTVQMDQPLVWTVSRETLEQHEKAIHRKGFLRKCHSFMLDTCRILVDVKKSLTAHAKT